MMDRRHRVFVYDWPVVPERLAVDDGLVAYDVVLAGQVGCLEDLAPEESRHYVGDGELRRGR